MPLRPWGPLDPAGSSGDFSALAWDPLKLVQAQHMGDETSNHGVPPFLARTPRMFQCLGSCAYDIERKKSGAHSDTPLS